MRTDCKNFEKCSAPLCPLLPEKELAQLGWISDEEICTIIEHRRKNSWIVRQRSIQRKADPDNPNEKNGEFRLYKVEELSKKAQTKPKTEEQKERIRKAGNSYREEKKRADLSKDS
jgi:hypothetical protein